MASALENMGIKAGDIVSVLCFNTHELLECHYSVPMTGAVLNALNTRLDAASLRFILEHGESRLLFYDTEFEPLLRPAVQGMAAPPACVSIVRKAGATQGVARADYDSQIAPGAP